MKKGNFYAAGLAVVLLALAVSAHAQRRGAARTGPAAPASDVSLPASDAVAVVDMRRLLNEAVPRAFGQDPARLAQVNADIDRFKTQTGVDARAFERVHVGARFVAADPDSFKLDHVVAVADGTFDPAALVAAGREAARGNHREERHAGKTIHVFTVNQRLKLFGVLPEMNVREFALAVLDSDTAAVGDLAAVRAALDAQAGRGRVSAALLALARQNPSAVLGFGANAPPALARAASGLGGEVERSLSSIRQFYGSLATTQTGFDLLVSARTPTAADARRLVDTLKALKTLGDFAAAQRTGDRGEAMRRALANVRITPQGPDAQIRLDIPAGDLPMLLSF
ncbi:MAG TPA: hypothetical protein VGV38_19095 [Pyrinomonadaceae bacterium]|nr:hypothetical protein [Pyrinomonadaceae bacterium]